MAVSVDAVDAPTDPISGIDVDDVDAARPVVKFDWTPHAKQREYLVSDVPSWG
jgi:hypothetical protein